MQLEGMRVAVRMLVEDPFTGYEGKFVKVPARNVVPKPLQKPHPPLWMACSRRESILQAARLGLGALTFSFVSPEEARQWVKDYYARDRKRMRAAGLRRESEFRGGRAVPVRSRSKRAWSRIGARKATASFSTASGTTASSASIVPAKTDIWDEYQERRRRSSRRPKAGTQDCVGTPKMSARRCANSKQAGIDQVICISPGGQDPARAAVLVDRAVLEGSAARSSRSANWPARRRRPNATRASPRRPWRASRRSSSRRLKP